MAASSIPAKAAVHADSELKIQKIRLPRTSSRLAFPRAFCRLVQTVRTVSGIPWLEGPLYRPGQEVDITQPAPNSSSWRPLVVLECAGAGKPLDRRDHPDVLWILWRLDPETSTWREVARALAINWEWALTLGPLAERLLSEPLGIHEIRGRGVEVAAELVTGIEGRLKKEPEPVRKEAWLSLYDQIPGRIV